MSEWTELKAALDNGAAIHAGEAYRTFMRATKEEARLFGGTSSDAAPFLKADYSRPSLPQGIYESLWADRRIRLLDPDSAGIVPITAAAGHVAKSDFMAVDRSYLADVYAAYNLFRHYQVAGSPGGMYLLSYRCVKQFTSLPSSVWDAYSACRNDLSAHSGNPPRAGIGFKFFYNPSQSGDTWTGQLDVCRPFFRLRKPSGVVFAREAFLCRAILGVYDYGWDTSSHDYLSFAGPDGYGSGDAFEFIPDSVGEISWSPPGQISGQAPVPCLEGSYRLPDLPETALRAAGLYTSATWGYALENGWEYANGFILRREYTDQNQYLDIFTR